MAMKSNRHNKLARDVCVASAILLAVLLFIYTASFGAEEEKQSSSSDKKHIDDQEALLHEHEALLHEHEALRRENEALLARLENLSSGEMSSETPDENLKRPQPIPQKAAASSTASTDGDASFGSRKRLLYNHIPKAGGKYTIKTLQELVPDEDLTIINEWGSSKRKGRETHFVIANFREPCSYYVSLWHFNVQNRGRIKVAFEKNVFPVHKDYENIFTDRDPNNLESFGKFFGVLRVRSPPVQCSHSRAKHPVNVLVSFPDR